jgi:hypothetical protein
VAEGRRDGPRRDVVRTVGRQHSLLQGPIL